MKRLQKKNITHFIKQIWKKEKKLFIFLFIIVLLLLTLPKISDQYLTEIPKEGGTVSEILIQSPPRFINPVLANSESDRDFLPLIYSSLLKRNENGEIVPSIATVQLSEDKKTYTVNLEKNIIFSDEKILTADDVIFTIKKIQDPFLRSPYQAQWLDVKTKKIDDHTLTITLPTEYVQFENTLASLYIMPQHLWFDISSTEFPFSPLNRKPIGSGPYRIENNIVDNTGKIKKYNLEKNQHYYDSEFFIDALSVYFFNDYEDYKKSLIFSDRKITKNIFSVSTGWVDEFSSDTSFLETKITPLTSARNFGLFIQKNTHPELKKVSLRNAISLAIDTETITKNTLHNYAKNISTHTQTYAERIQEAKKILAAADFILEEKEGKITLLNKESKKPVTITLSVLDSAELNEVSNVIKKNLVKIGINLEIISYNESDLIDSVIRDRDFEMLLFAYQKDTPKADLYYFFHSSQTEDPGINISGFSNTEADKILLELRKNITNEEREKLTEKLYTLIHSDYSYIPLYSPDFMYIMDKRIKNFTKQNLNHREERFIGINKWYSQTEKILPIFNKTE